MRDIRQPMLRPIGGSYRHRKAVFLNIAFFLIYVSASAALRVQVKKFDG